MPKITPCKHGLPISKCKICFKEHHKEHIREYRQRPEVKQRMREYIKAYFQRPEVKEYIKGSYGEYNIIQYLIRKYTIDLNNLNARIKREWIIPPIQMQGKQIELQNLIDNLQIIKEYTVPLPNRTMRARVRRRMLNELLSTEGRLVSWRMPLQRGLV